MKLLFSFLLLSISLYSQTYRDTTNVIALTFNEPMKIWDLSILTNYLVVNSLNDTIPVYSTGYNPEWVQQDSGLSRIALLLPQLQWGVSYAFTVSNVRDLAGNVIDPIHQSVSWDFSKSENKPKPVNINSRKTGQYQIPLTRATAKDTSLLTRLPSRAIDGITYTGDITQIWNTKPLPEWIIVDLDMARDVYRIDLSFSAFHSGRIYSYSIDYSWTGGTWKNVVPLAYSIPNQEWMRHNIFISCAKIRINFITNNQNTNAGLYEIKVFGE